MFGSEVTAQLRTLAHEIAESKGAIILYDEMATLAPGCAEPRSRPASTGRRSPAILVVPALVSARSSRMPTRSAHAIWAYCPMRCPAIKPAEETGMAYAEILSNPDIKALYVMGANPARHLAQKQLPSNIEFLIVQDILLTETAQQADVVLPAVTFAEKDGSMTNVDHHVQAIRHALRPLPGAKADWEILVDMAQSLGHKWNYSSPQDVLLEIAASNAFYSGLTWDALGKQGVRTQEQEVARA